jgi:hypothetical protein
MDVTGVDFDSLEYELNAISYSGFDAKIIRETCRDQFGATDTLRAIGAYIKIGNNPSRLIEKVTNDTVGRMIYSRLQELGVRGKGSNRNRHLMTLPRIAMAFAPIVLLMRFRFKDQLQSRGSNMEIAYQDICLTPLMNFNLLPNSYAEFLRLFSTMIKGDMTQLDNFTNISREAGSTDVYNQSCIDLIKRNWRDVESGDKDSINKLIKMCLSCTEEGEFTM